MADIDYFDGDFDRDFDGSEGAPREAAAAAARPMLGVLVNWAGALISLGLVLGMAVWAVQLMMRDVSGVPVIQALEGPMRVQPDDPGGTQAPHQGLAVNRIAEGEEAPPVPDRLVLAPPPLELQDVRFDMASASEAEAPRARPAEEGAEATAAAEAIETTGAATLPSGDAGADTMALIDRLLAEAQGLDPADAPRAAAAPAEIATRAAVSQSQSQSAQARIIPASVPGVAASPRPSFRPVSLVAGQGAARAPAAPAGPVDLVADELPDGTRLVQLGAFDTPAIARSEWDRLAQRYPDYFEGRPRVVEEASSGGQSFFRLRAGGFDDLAGSRRFCAVLVAQGTACIPVTVR
ncbi:SPOR domain-containing protein [Roseibacterium sp. SDUM158017]|uniref:SPOR domain-containing protein n=1 Tax=Roseicyclus salinarum TaxID=3036773 RepID=UPI0024158652|nr:SPOR domain-containing protein [Roseibacterium sp. SDUM158017]MDG4649772.1 SPOR domain-containing protein [Roseibacterium sp. SDUM158017]